MLDQSHISVHLQTSYDIRFIWLTEFQSLHIKICQTIEDASNYQGKSVMDVQNMNQI